MSSILRRLADVAKSYIHAGNHERISAGPERRFNPEEERSDVHNEDFHSSTNRTGSQERQAKTGNGGIPQQVAKDLATFNLTPPSSLKAVKDARNREIKKYHSDKFVNDPEKLETSKEIMQIYNAAYDRLQAYYRTYD